jgi:hypothetical protein
MLAPHIFSQPEDDAGIPSWVVISEGSQTGLLRKMSVRP